MKISQNLVAVNLSDNSLFDKDFTVAVIRSEEVFAGYLPELAMRHIGDLHTSDAKTDVRDTTIITDDART